MDQTPLSFDLTDFECDTPQPAKPIQDAEMRSTVNPEKDQIVPLSLEDHLGNIIDEEGDDVIPDLIEGGDTDKEGTAANDNDKPMYDDVSDASDDDGPTFEELVKTIQAKKQFNLSDHGFFGSVFLLIYSGHKFAVLH